MSSDRVNDEFDDELLSAYVDGELSAGERAAVEARLKSDPQAARLVGELRSLSKAIKSLPRETLGEDMRLRVQAEIEEARSAAAAEVLPMTPPYDRWNGIRRGVWWSAAAIAATVALVTLMPENAGRNERDVAQRESEVKRAPVEQNKNRKIADDEVPPGLAGSMRALHGPAPASTAAPRGGAQEAATPSVEPAIAASEDAAHRVTPGATAEPQSRRELDVVEDRQLAAGAQAPAAASAPAAPVQAPAVLSGEAGGSAGAMKAPAQEFKSTLERATQLGEEVVVAPKQIELVVKQPGGVARFEELLKRQDVQLVEPPAKVAQGEQTAKQLTVLDQVAQKEKQAEAKTAGQDQAKNELADNSELSSSGQTGQPQRMLNEGDLAALGKDVRPDEERIVVEAPRAEIGRLVAAVVADKDFFAATSGEELQQLGLDRGRAGSFSFDKPADARGFGGLGGGDQTKGAPTATSGSDIGAAKPFNSPRSEQLETRRAGGKPFAGRAWRLPLAADSTRFAREGNRKAEEESVRMRDKSDKSSTSSTAGPTGASTSVVGGELALREKLAKQAESGDDKVQVVFVLRPAPVPAASAATAADGAPAAAAQPAAPADPATAKPR